MIQPFFSKATLAAHLATNAHYKAYLAVWPPDERVRGMTTRQFRHHLAALAEQDKRKLREYRRKLSDAW